ncbi:MULTISPECIES: hypothetical protein [Nocardia]|uniref:Uncharacterized protein n=1 Tax=Nocardia asteroides NBRC 15531 TaxID=1110697 RepID=U5EPR6_NOCAS|nr:MULTISPECIES: hypothetical protein [Nocardia]TLF63371.1 hypothetical protein FEK33_25385 [Nocardia asteroides NBRC 15531]UGT47200.1 hypothetical protein LT345_22130 [Nocardia asteroides]SFM76578.1 hypothetical protein SAMN05444423_104148 [Nocardia asteroides]VEG33916.1 Uncharacterised protein [Nocardia asteroides]GAD87074.1 hypothetical protein NCAST_34_02030 [Nocardia asteroides NBRC 15531]
MNGSNEPNSPQSAARQADVGESAGALANPEITHGFDCTLSTLVRQLDAMTIAGWVTSVAEPSGELR